MIILATDHAGFEHKEILKKYLLEKGEEIKDLGTNSKEPCDYPDFMIPAAREVAKNPANNRAIIFGGSGQGEAIAANRIKGVRAAVYYGGPEKIITFSRTHNNANILSIGARFVNKKKLLRIVELWLNTEFSGEERHIRRIQKIDQNNIGD